MSRASTRLPQHQQAPCQTRPDRPPRAVLHVREPPARAVRTNPNDRPKNARLRRFGGVGGALHELDPVAVRILDERNDGVAMALASGGRGSFTPSASSLRHSALIPVTAIAM